MTAKRFYIFGAFRLDPDTRVLLRNGDVIRIPPKAVDILLALLESAGQPVDKETLLHTVWPDTFVEETNLAHHISVLRRTLGEGESGRAYIETIPKRGYRFVGEVEETAAGDAVEKPGQTIDVPSGAHSAARQTRRTVMAALTIPAVSGVATFLWLKNRGLHAPLYKSLAVLPFRNLSGKPDDDFICDGLTEVLIGEVAKITVLRVISRSSVMRYRDNRKPLPQIAQELHAEALIEGSIARFGARARVSVQLLDGAEDKHLWGETYERDLTDIPRLWSEVAISIAHEIQAQMQPELRARAGRGRVRQQAFEAYLRGRYYWNKRTADHIRTAIVFFRKAIDADPAYAEAYAGLADCYNQLGTVLIGGERPMEIRPLAIAAAKRALEVDPQLAEAHAALAYAKLYDWEWAEAEAGFRHAIELNPSYAPAHLWYSHFLSMWKRPEEALREVRLSEQLDPLSPIIQTQTGWILQHARRHDEAIRKLRKVLDADPDYLWALWRIGSSYTSKSMFAEAIDALEKAAKLSGRSPAIVGTLAETYGLAGRKAEARKLLDELKAEARQRYVPAIAFAHAYIGLGDEQQFFASLENAYQQREQGIAWLAVWEKNSAYRSDPRFRDLIRRVGLPGE
ncbi:MAG: winged helix-turn-helix domain-containing protein [Bryobacterales bacterium]|nr:winged helix-turn-helix domain-containing protein [Bryobacterales bacterium]